MICVGWKQVFKEIVKCFVVLWDLTFSNSLFFTGKQVKEKETDKELPEIDFSSAFLGPHLWEKTYDASDFDLEYMDLDEFLGENSIPLEDSTLGQKKCSSAIPSQHSSVHYYPKENIASDVQDLQKTPAHSCPSLLSPSTSFGIVAKESLSVAGISRDTSIIQPIFQSLV